MPHSEVAELQKENGSLRQLVIKLSKVIVRDIADQKRIFGPRSNLFAPRLLLTVMPNELAPLLREASLHCAHASRDCADVHTAQELEGMSVELADVAQNLETPSVPRPDK